MGHRKNSKISAIYKRMQASTEPGRVWTVADFDDLPANSVAQALHRLVAEGYLTRYARGLYYRQVETVLGPSVPNKAEIAKAIARSKRKQAVETGYTGYAAMGLTTQLPGKITLATDKPLRSTLLKDKRVRYVLRSRNTLSHSEERWVLDALRDITKISNTTPEEVVERILMLIKQKAIDVERLAKLALQGEPPRVRALLGAIGEQVGISDDLLGRLRRSLNSSTIYKITVGDKLKTARNWRIVA